jgi:N-acetylmuramic acid 6-phosphate (MurNAc-6-P) etherase
MPNYRNSKPYTIRSVSRPDLIYVGSTTRRLSERFGEHKKSSNTCSSKQIIDIGDAYIELIENFPCDNKEQLLRREGELIRSMDCVNKNIAGRTKKQWNSDNKEAIAIQKKQYQSDNKEAIAIQVKQYRIDKKNMRICVCGGKYNIGNTSKTDRHYTTDKHTTWVDNFYKRLHTQLKL